jgi:glutamine amidotransferase
MQSVAVVDFRLCNIDSIVRALVECGAKAFATRDPSDLARSDRIVLPGVGAFPAAMANLRAAHLDSAIAREVADVGKPFLGICLGMQLMARHSAEGGDSEGLGLVEGDVVRLVAKEKGERVPHMGWNTVHAEADTPLFAGIAPDKDFYFVHSYHMRCADAAAVTATTPYCGGFASAVRGPGPRAFGVQFHPEKSQKPGFQLLRNFLAL